MKISKKSLQDFCSKSASKFMIKINLKMTKIPSMEKFKKISMEKFKKMMIKINLKMTKKNLQDTLQEKSSRKNVKIILSGIPNP